VRSADDQPAADRFRIKIWHFDADQIDASLAGGSNEGTTIGGGGIVIHK